MQQRFEATYRYNSVFWTKNFTELDLLDVSECNNTMFVGKSCDQEPASTLMVSYISVPIFLLDCLQSDSSVL